jgi:hypothetical protein
MSATVKLREGDDRPYRDTKTGEVYRVLSPKLRLLSPYVLVADRAAQSRSGATHIASVVEVGGVPRLDPMTHCGLNSSSKPQPMQWVKGPTRITCLRCTTIALLTLGREGRLPGCER